MCPLYSSVPSVLACSHDCVVCLQGGGERCGDRDGGGRWRPQTAPRQRGEHDDHQLTALTRPVYATQRQLGTLEQLSRSLMRLYYEPRLTIVRETGTV